jgi:parallel beta-helix repeat protein
MIAVLSLNNNNITRNTVTNNNGGIALNETTGTISNDRIDNNNASYNTINGIILKRADTNTIINNDVHVSPETRQRVLDAMQRLGYVANRQARSLAGGSDLLRRRRCCRRFPFRGCFRAWFSALTSTSYSAARCSSTGSEAECPPRWRNS